MAPGFRLALVGFSLSICISNALADDRLYSVTQIPIPEGAAFDLNDAGQVVGRHGNVPGQVPSFSGFTWSQATGIVDLGAGALAGGTNNAGQVVGRHYDQSDHQAFLWTAAGGLRRLSDLPGGEVFTGASHSEALKINGRGQIIGHVNDGDYRAFVRNPDGALRFLDLPPGASSSGGPMAFGINDSGDVVGRAYFGNTVYHAVLWPAAGGYRDLGDLPGGLEFGNAASINNRGEILGLAHVAPDPSNPLSAGHRAVLFRGDGTIRELGVLSGMSDSSASDINDLGEAVGWCGPGAWYDQRAFLWSEEAGMRDLNDLLDDSGRDWRLSNPVGINNAGQIVVLGQFQGQTAYAFLSPVPDPCAIALAAGLAPSLLLRRRAGARVQ